MQEKNTELYSFLTPYVHEAERKNESVKELYSLLTPYVHEAERKNDSVTEENVEELILLADGYGVVEEIIDYVKEHPEDDFWSFLRLIPEGLAPGDDGADLLDDDDE